VSYTFASCFDLNNSPKPKNQPNKPKHNKRLVSINKKLLFQKIESQIQHFNEERTIELIREEGDANLRGQKVQRNYFKVPNKNFLFPSPFLMENAGIPWVTISKNLYLLYSPLPILIISPYETKLMIISTSERIHRDFSTPPKARSRSTKSSTKLDLKSQKKKKGKDEKQKGAFGILNPNQKISLDSIFSQEILPPSFPGGHHSLPSLISPLGNNNNNMNVHNSNDNTQLDFSTLHKKNEQVSEEKYMHTKRFSCNVLYQQRVYIIGGCKYSHFHSSSSSSSSLPTPLQPDQDFLFEFECDDHISNDIHNLDTQIQLQYFDFGRI
jgi:hypothetical protein